MSQGEPSSTFAADSNGTDSASGPEGEFRIPWQQLFQGSSARCQMVKAKGAFPSIVVD